MPMGTHVAHAGNRTEVSTHRLGVAMQIASAVAFSSAGLFTRLITADAPTLLFWRGVFASLSVLAVIAWMRRGRVLASFQAMRRADIAVALMVTVAMTNFIWALRLTTVAEVSIIYAAAPLLTAAMSWIVWRERQGAATLLACFATATGVAVMVGGAVGQGHLAGDMLALVMTFAAAGFMILIQRARSSILPAMAVAALLTALLVLPFASPLHTTGADIAWAAVFGFVQLCVGLVLMTVGARMVSSTEVALYSTLDVPLAPLWVWLAFGETPSWTIFAGGGIVVAAVLSFTLARGGH